MGTWALPQTQKQANKLQKLMLNPLPAKMAEDQLYHLLGDDDLFDKISSVRKECSENHDVRNMVKSSLRFFVETNDGAVEPWNPKALEICEQICQSSS